MNMTENKKNSVAGQAEQSSAVVAEKVITMMMEPKYFGDLWKYVNNDEVTDIDFNGTDLWITDSQNTRTAIKDHGITTDFVNNFSQRVANQVSKSFNKMSPLLEAETETLRISIVHESAAVSGRSICLRKTLPIVRIDAKSIIKDEYCPRDLLNLLVNCITSKMNFVIGGEPGAGKTEAAKYWSQFIPNEQRVITIEDSPEWHFKKINPGHDCIEMRVCKDFDYAMAIKTCLRQNPKWIMLSEARSIEAKYLIESWSTGVNGVTTIHTDDVRKVPSRLINMMSDRNDADRLENDVYDFANVAFLVRRKQRLDGTAHRYIDQMAFLYRENNKINNIHMIVKDGKMVSHEIPENIMFKLSRSGIDRPFDCPAVDADLGNSYRCATEHNVLETDIDQATKVVTDQQVTQQLLQLLINNGTNMDVGLNPSPPLVEPTYTTVDDMDIATVDIRKIPLVREKLMRQQSTL